MTKEKPMIASLLRHTWAAPLILAAAALLPPPAAAQVIRYHHLDALGSVRALTGQNGAILERHDYLPFGEECTTGACAANPGAGGGHPRKFTGKERDAETGFDYFGARYYGSGFGRFTSVDPVMNITGNLVKPQKWNRYAYSLNNPLRYLDPDGREEITIVINAFIPHDFLTMPFAMKGDGREVGQAGTSRTTQTIVVETDKAKNARGGVDSHADTGPSLGAGDHGIRTRNKAPADGIRASVDRADNGDVVIRATAVAPYPSLPVHEGGSIRYDLTVTVSQRDGQTTVAVAGTHARFPAYEVLAQREGSSVRQVVYGRSPGKSQLAPYTILAPSMRANEEKVLEPK
jgi:RHS repeat-associated protein